MGRLDEIQEQLEQLGHLKEIEAELKGMEKETANLIKDNRLLRMMSQTSKVGESDKESELNDVIKPRSCAKAAGGGHHEGNKKTSHVFYNHPVRAKSELLADGGTDGGACVWLITLQAQRAFKPLKSILGVMSSVKQRASAAEL